MPDAVTHFTIAAIMHRMRVLIVIAIAGFILPAGVGAEHYVLVGDSTVAPNDGNDGWGDALTDFLSSEDTVSNRAANGRSTQTFINEGRWQDTLELEPDCILIQFGHNDQKIDQESLGTYAGDEIPGSQRPRETDATNSASRLFRGNLRRMIDDARAIGAVPILVTPVARRNEPYDSVKAQIDRNNEVLWSDLSSNGYSLRDYADATKAVGLEKEVMVIDLNHASLQLYAKMIADGEDLGKLGPDGTHFGTTGMVRIAELVADALLAPGDSDVDTGAEGISSPKAATACQRTLSMGRNRNDRNSAHSAHTKSGCRNDSDCQRIPCPDRQSGCLNAPCNSRT